MSHCRPVRLSPSLSGAGASPGNGPDASSNSICVAKPPVAAAPSTFESARTDCANEVLVDLATTTPISDQFATRLPPAALTSWLASAVDAPCLYRMM